MAVEHGRDSVSRAVDVDDLARFGDGVGGGEIDLRASGLFACVRRFAPVPRHVVILVQRFKKAEGIERDAAAEADGFSGELLRDRLHGLLPGLEHTDGKAVALEIFDSGF